MEIILSGMSSGLTGGLAFWLQLPGGTSLLGLAPLLFIFAIFYFLLIMPQQRKQKKWQLMLSELKNGDKIVTSGGLRGTIISLKDDALTLRVPPDNLKLEISRASVVSVTPAGGATVAVLVIVPVAAGSMVPVSVMLTLWPT